MHVIDAELALTPEQRQIGLMHRRDMPANHGMLFVFESPQVQCFWMKNTCCRCPSPSSDDGGGVVNITDMKPLDETSHCSQKPVRFVLEMNQGWFAKKASSLALSSAVRPGSVGAARLNLTALSCQVGSCSVDLRALIRTNRPS